MDGQHFRDVLKRFNPSSPTYMGADGTTEDRQERERGGNVPQKPLRRNQPQAASVHGARAPAVTKNKELRIVMVGKTGIGKSATGNTILGRQCFDSKFSATSQTDECSKGKARVDGQKVAVIDTPGLFDTRCDPEKTHKDISQCISFSSPGPHVFLVIIRLGRFTEEENQTVQMIQKMFGETSDRYSMVLFTHGDLLEKTTIEEFMENCSDLKELVARCNGQYHVFNNKLEDRSQVIELFKKIKNIVQKNGGSHYTNEMFQDAERAIEEEKQRILEEKEEQIRKEKEELEKRLRAEYDEKLRDVTENLQAEIEKERREREKKHQELNVMVNDMKLERERWAMNRAEMEMDMAREREKLEMERKRSEVKREKEKRAEEMKREREEREREWKRRSEEMKRDTEERERCKKRQEGMKREEQIKDARGKTYVDVQLKKEYERKLKEQMVELDKKHRREARREAEKKNPPNGFFKKIGKIFSL